MPYAWLSCIVLVLAGCAHQELAERVQPVASLFAQHAFVQHDSVTADFTLRSWQRISANSGDMHVYIEGDGLAWVTRSQPSLNPTPLHSIVPTLAVQDTQAAQVVYLARPCQYVSLAERACDQKYWTQARFAPEVVAAMSQALTRLKQQTPARRLVLIGYSGGGALAVLIAAQRQDVAAIVTIAGNLDHQAWTGLHGISPLLGSLNPPQVATALANIRQLHLVGGQDKNMPQQVYQSYRTAFPPQANIQLQVIPEFDHRCCWPQRWPGLLQPVLD